MTKDESMTKNEVPTIFDRQTPDCHSGLGINSSFAMRHSEFRTLAIG